MFIEVNATHVNAKWIINVRAISFVCPQPDNSNKARIYLIGDNVPIDVDNSYDEIKALINKAYKIFKGL